MARLQSWNWMQLNLATPKSILGHSPKTIGFNFELLGRFFFVHAAFLVLHDLG